MKPQQLFVYIVESPLQALCALEINLQNPDASHHIYYREFGSERERNNKQTNQIICMADWSVCQSLSHDARGWRKHLQIRQTLAYFRTRYSKYKVSLYLGEYRAQWMHFARAAIRPSQTTFLDDGAASIYVIKDFINKHIFYPFPLWKYSWRSNFRSLFYIGLLDKNEMDKPVQINTLFHAFEKDDRVTHLNLECILGKYKNPKQAFGNKIYYFGSKYSEAGVLTLDDEVAFLNLVFSYYKEKGYQNIFYIAHRDETDEKLEIIRKSIGFNVLYFDETAELNLIKSLELPKEISGAYTTVLNNMKVLFPGVKITSFRIPNNWISGKYSKRINEVYQYFQSLKIEVIDL